jgi:hypothetical protein
MDDVLVEQSKWIYLESLNDLKCVLNWFVILLFYEIWNVHGYFKLCSL